MKHLNTLNITVIALAAVINVVGGQLALVLKLPIYLDMMGTLLVALLLGPIYGMIPGLISGILLGVTMDVYALYFLPVQLITGFVAGCMFKTKWMTRGRGLLGTWAITLPGTLVSATIAAFLFGGFTSSGSSVIVLLLRNLGFHEIASVFMVQVVTDYLDRIISITLVFFLVKALPNTLVKKIKAPICQ